MLLLLQQLYLLLSSGRPFVLQSMAVALDLEQDQEHSQDSWQLEGSVF